MELQSPWLSGMMQDRADHTHQSWEMGLIHGQEHMDQSISQTYTRQSGLAQDTTQDRRLVLKGQASKLTPFLRQCAEVAWAHHPGGVTDTAVVGRAMAYTVGVRWALLQSKAAVVGVCRRRGQAEGRARSQQVAGSQPHLAHRDRARHVRSTGPSRREAAGTASKYHWC